MNLRIFKFNPIRLAVWGFNISLITMVTFGFNETMAMLLVIIDATLILIIYMSITIILRVFKLFIMEFYQV